MVVMKNNYFSKIFIMVIIASVMTVSGCVQDTTSDVTGNNTFQNSTNSKTRFMAIEKIEVFHFHTNRQCQGCINVGKCAEGAVNEYFNDELKSGLIVFGHINAELSENAALVQKYEATGASLWIGTYGKDGSFSKEQDIDVWYKTSDMEKCTAYLKGVIEEKLKGNVSWT